MASIYLRHQTWWIQFYPTTGGKPLRISLETPNPAQADLLRKKVELLLKLASPRLQELELPETLRILLAPFPFASSHLEKEALKHAASEEPSSQPAPAVSRPSLEKVLCSYYHHIREDNAPAWVANKISVLRHFFGSELILKATGLTSKGADGTSGFFPGLDLSGITAETVEKFIDARQITRGSSAPKGLSKKTKRHYKEIFHDFFEFCLRRGFLAPTNWHSPNPMRALPSYHVKNNQIVYLTEPEIEEQFRVLQPYPMLHAAAAMMIYAGLRRSETLWLTQDSINASWDYLSVVNRRDENDIESTLKTGQRPVSILPQLKVILESYLKSLASDRWLFPNAKGGRWLPDNFSDALLTTTFWNRIIGRSSAGYAQASIFARSRELGARSPATKRSI
jgi:integrase